MKLSDFDYFLPKDLIAQYPAQKRGGSRLLLINRAKQTIEHHNFCSLIDFINQNDLLVLNNTRVRSVRLLGKRLSGGKVDILLLNRVEQNTYEALVKPLAKIKFNEKIVLNNNGVSLSLVERRAGKNIVRFNCDTDIEEKLESIGQMPLPPYIKRLPEESDRERYQTVFAKKDGAIAAPTAGLHFTKEFLQELETKGVGIEQVTLHVGQGTFLPVKTEEIEQHEIHKEYFEISSKVLARIRKTKEEKKKIFAVGTTAMRVLESVDIKSDKDVSGYTELFIYPPYNFKVADCLLTNFHLPKTTLFMLVCAFAGTELTKEAYSQAVKEKYRFFSYGDAMLII